MSELFNPTISRPHLTEPQRAQSDRGFLWFSYIGAAVIPIIGGAVAIYLAVSQRRASIRRHAIGVAAVALAAAGIYVGVALSLASSHQDTNVSSDLESLLLNNGIVASGTSCVHQNGNQYVCQTTVNGQPQTASVTDDGHTIYEVGISGTGNTG